MRILSKVEMFHHRSAHSPSLCWWTVIHVSMFKCGMWILPSLIIDVAIIHTSRELEAIMP